jgi:hypothetical protein
MESANVSYSKSRGVRNITLDASLNATEFYARCGYTRKQASKHRCKNGVELETVGYEKNISG